MSVIPVLFLAAALGAFPAQPVNRLATAVPAPRLHPAVVPATVFAIALVVIAADRLSVVVAGCIAAFTIVRVVATRRRMRACRQQRAIISDFLGQVVSSLEAGSTVAAACERAASRLPATCPPPLAGGIRHLVAASRASAAPGDVGATDAGRDLAEVAAMWSLAVNRGLPMAQLLSKARERIDAQRRHTAATDAALAGPKTTATVLSLLPVAGVVMGAAMGADPLGLLLGGGPGGWLLVLGTTLVSAGYLTCQEIITKAAQ